MSTGHASVALITGASSGIGEATARELARAGYHVAASARRADRLEALCQAIRNAGGAATALPCDIVEREAASQLVTQAAGLGRLEVAVNNAGIMTAGPLHELSEAALTDMVRINVEAAFRFAQAVVRHFRQQGSGHLINISSILGTKVRPNTGVYAGSKYAIEAFTEALRMECARSGVRVTAIEPGLVMTELHNHWERHPKDTFNIPRPLLPEDIARCIRFAVEQPPHVSISRMLIMPSDQEL